MQILDHNQRRVPAVSFVRASTRARATWVWVDSPTWGSALGLASSTVPSGPSSRCSIPAAARPLRLRHPSPLRSAREAAVSERTAEYGVVRRRESPRNIKDEPVALLGVLDGRRRQPALADAGFADHGDGAAAAILAGQGLAYRVALALAADQRGAVVARTLAWRLASAAAGQAVGSGVDLLQDLDVFERCEVSADRHSSTVLELTKMLSGGAIFCNAAAM